MAHGEGLVVMAQAPPAMTNLQFRVKLNGKVVCLDAATVDPLAPLASVLRQELGFRGTKIGCGQGNCGACTVNLKRYGELYASCINSCLCAAGSLMVSPETPINFLPEITTVEGVAAAEASLAGSVATTIANCNGTQCGYCTPGMVMKAAYFQGKLAAQPDTPHSCRDIEDLLDGNLCRCTGYRPLLHSFKQAFSSEEDPHIQAELKQTPPMVVCDEDGNYSRLYSTGHLRHPNVVRPAEDDHGVPRQPQRDAEPFQPPSGMAPAAYEPAVRPAIESHPLPVMRFGPQLQGLWYAPASIHHVLQLLAEHGPQVRLVAGNINSAWVPLNSLPDTTVYVSLLGVSELSGPAEQPGGPRLCIHAAATLSELYDKLLGLQASGEYELSSVCEHLFSISNIQVRYRGTVAGNVNAVERRDGILHSDISLLLAALNGEMEVAMLSTTTKERINATVCVYDFLNDQNAVKEAFERAHPGVKIGDVTSRWLATAFLCDLPKRDAGDAVHVGRVSHRRENHPTMCSVAWRRRAGQGSGGGDNGGSDLFFTGPHATSQDERVLVLGHVVLAPQGASPAAASSGVSRELVACLRKKLACMQPRLGVENERLVLHLAARVFGLDKDDGQQQQQLQPGTRVGQPGAMDGVGSQRAMRTSVLEERKVACQFNNSQHFYVDPRLAPTTEPIIKPASYAHVTGTALYASDADVPMGCTHVTPVLSPAAIVEFDIEGLRDAVQELAVVCASHGTHVLSAADIPDRRTDKQRADGVPPWLTAANVYAPVVPHQEGSSSGRAITRVEPGDFGEFFIAPGVTTYAGQCVLLVCARSEAESQRVARAVQSELDDAVLRSKGPLFTEYKGSMLLKDHSGSAVLSMEQSRRRGLSIDPYDPNKVVPVVHARGKEAIYADKESANWGLFWKELKGKPKKEVTYVERGFKTDGSVDEAPGSAVVTGAQSHLYMETQAALLTRQEHRFNIHHSTQSASDVQSVLTPLLGARNSADIVVHNKRVGGGFGGKTTCSAIPAAWAGIACLALGTQAARVVLDRQVDTKVMGVNMSFEGRYRVAVDTRTGKVLAMDLRIDADSGCSAGTTPWIMLKAAISSDNFYFVPEFRAECNGYLTHTQKGNPMRSFGGVQAAAMVESALDHAFHQLVSNQALLMRQSAGTGGSSNDPPVMSFNAQGEGPSGFRSANFYRHEPNMAWPRTLLQRDNRSRSFINYGQELLQTNIMNDPKGGTWAAAMAGYRTAVAAAEEFNSMNRLRKQAVAIMPLLYAGGYEFAFLNQNTAMINVYNNGGRVLVNQAGVEMGNGCQVNIQVGGINTDTVPNAQSTGASSGSDLNVPAVVDGATKLRKRLECMLDAALRDVLLKRTRINAYGPLPPFVLECEFPAAARSGASQWRAIQEHVRQWPIGAKGSAEAAVSPALACLDHYVLNNRSWNTPPALSGEPHKSLEELSECWAGVVRYAYQQRVALQETGRSGDPADGGRVWNMQNMACYFNYAAAWMHVEVDGLTGEIEALRYDVFYDAGGSRNPAIDIGQIEGGAVQGLGHMLTEVVKYDKKGRRLTGSIMSYAIPDHRTIPRSLNTHLVWRPGTDVASPSPSPIDTRPVHERAQPVELMNRARAKTTGEPPLVLAVTLIMAARYAITALRRELLPVGAGQATDAATTATQADEPFVHLNTPLTPTAVLQAIYGDGQDITHTVQAIYSDGRDTTHTLQRKKKKKKGKKKKKKGKAGGRLGGQ
ncbi:hypothetical protein JKP88DRAFT_318265 [Tribonema minus]|uniref:FAD-binding PCMH-type domain-containing protein n=1 Tax=Tribonema minus TaxID=303371 RepID=A0A835Z5W6_9STRA|nr:hypothetical protein JKP88DRAFT_318265 [Tribonema minus]